jgi:hypothetical protein
MLFASQSPFIHPFFRDGLSWPYRSGHRENIGRPAESRHRFVGLNGHLEHHLITLIQPQSFPHRRWDCDLAFRRDSGSFLHHLTLSPK